MSIKMIVFFNILLILKHNYPIKNIKTKKYDPAAIPQLDHTLVCSK